MTDYRRNPRVLENLTPFDSAAGLAAVNARWDKTRRITEERAADAGVDPPRKLPKSLSQIGPTRVKPMYRWDKTVRESVYLAQAIPVEIRQMFYDIERKLTRQYAPGRQSENVQYRLLVTRIAMLMCQVAVEETKEKPDRYLCLKYDKQIQDHIAQLQKYTESEKREVYVTQEIVTTTLSKVISIAEATITDAGQRAAFMRGLGAMVTDEPLLLPAGREQTGDTIDAEFSPVDPDNREVVGVV